jgi:hypothetical protein
MEVTKVERIRKEQEHHLHTYTMEELIREYIYYRADMISKELLQNGLISKEEYEKLTEKNYKKIKPFSGAVIG